MELRNIDINRSPIRKGYTRLQAEVIYDDASMSPEIYWYEVEDQYSSNLSDKGNPWLACLLPLAATIGEKISISQPVDAIQYYNALELMRVWNKWHPTMHVVPVECNLSNSIIDIDRRDSAFFSGGVDSLFSILRNDDGSPSHRKYQVEKLLYVWGFDIPLKNEEPFIRLKNSLQIAATSMNKTFVPIISNLRETRSGEVPWGLISHGCALASSALALESIHRHVLLGSSQDYGYMAPYGSHPITDPLLSTSGMIVVHDGCGFNRFEKTEFLANSNIAAEILHVCWEQRDDTNCGYCVKCYRTMTSLELLGVLDNFVTFGSKPLDMKRLGSLFLQNTDLDYYFPDLYRLAQSKGRTDIVRAIRRSITRSRLANGIIRYASQNLRPSSGSLDTIQHRCLRMLDLH
ncbi:MAG: hypothetical protein ACYC0V_17705 [Armatimonadota bacterium]